MPIDGKYGRVMLPDNSFSDIAEDEPVFLFRAKDALVPTVLQQYAHLCRSVGSPQHHLDLIEAALGTIIKWQGEHRAKVPDSNSWRNRA